MLKRLTLWLLVCSLSLGAVSTTPNVGLNQNNNITIMQCDNNMIVYSMCSNNPASVNSDITCVTTDTVNKEVYKNHSGSSIKNVFVFTILKKYQVKDCVVVSSNKPTRSDIVFVDRFKEKNLSTLIRNIQSIDITIQQVNDVIEKN